MLKQIVAYIMMFVVAAGWLTSCKQGCTDIKAINYNHRAQQEDGTCYYCDSFKLKTTVIVSGFDFGSGSNENVVDLAVTQTNKGHKGNGCNYAGTPNDSSCTISVVIINKTQFTISGFYFLSLRDQNFQNVWTDQRSINSIPPHGSVDLGDLFNDCNVLQEGLLSLSLSGMSYQ